MAKTKISEFSNTPGNNTDIDSINIAEGCAPSGINDAIRELMAQLKDFQTGAQGDSFNGPVGTTTAAAGAFTTLSASGTTTLSGLTASTALALDASKNVVSVTNTGTGNNVLATSPTLVTPILGTPTSVTLTNATGLPISTGVSGLGTGIATALAVNVGSAGAPVINGGALGTPSSGTVTNLTGTASININGTVGATTPTTGAFTTLTTSSTVTLNGGTANGVSYLDASKVLTTGSALTFDGTNLGVGTASPYSDSGFRAVDIRGSTGAQLQLGTTSGREAELSGTATGGLTLNTINVTPIRFFINGNEQMRLTSTGLGIGTSSPAGKLQVSSNNPEVYITDTSVSAPDSAALYLGIGVVTQYAGLVADFGNDRLNIRHNQATRATFDSSGNLGLGVTPSAWLSAYKALQFTGGAVQGGTAGVLELYANNFRDSNGDFIYTASGGAGRYAVSDAHRWFTAPSGTAGNAISFTQAMSLNADGQWLLNTTSPIYSNADAAHIYGRVSGGNQFGLMIGGDAASYTCYAARFLTNNSGAVVGSITFNTSATAYNTSSDYRLKNITGPITTSGAYIDSLNPVEGTWKADGSTFVGLIAHEVQEASRTTVATGVKDGEQMQGMDYSSAEIIANLIAEVKSLRQRLAAAGI